MLRRFNLRETSEEVKDIVESSAKTLKATERTKKLGEELEKWYLDEYCSRQQVILVVTGQYDGGKSMILKALTRDKGIKIGANVTTDKATEYPWREVLLVDTPGVWSGRPDLDEISFDYISKADLIVYTITSELFTPEGANLFKKLAVAQQRAEEMMLVVNKMTQTHGEPKVLKKDIQKVVEPIHLPDLLPSFIDAKSMVDSWDEKDTEEKNFLIKESNFDEFVIQLNKFIDKKGLRSRLTTPLERSINSLEKARIELTGGEETARNLMELLRRRRLILEASKTRLINSFDDLVNDLAHQIVMKGNEVASMINGQHKKEEIDHKINDINREMENLCGKTGENIDKKVQDEFKKLDNKLKELGESLLGKAVESVLQHPNMGKVPEVEVDEGKPEGPIRKLGKEVPYREVFNKVGKGMAKVSRDGAYKLGKFFKVKFKPWGAIKLGKIINNVGKVLVVIGPVIDTILKIWEEAKEEKYQVELQENRNNIRSGFHEKAEEVKQDYIKRFNDTALSLVDEKIKMVEEEYKKIEVREESEKEMLEKIDSNIEGARILILNIQKARWRVT